MRYRILVPAEPNDALRGAAVVQCARRAAGATYARVFAGRDQFGELCAQAIRQGRLVALRDGCIEVGFYDAVDGELRAHQHGLAVLERWLGRPVTRSDLEARENLQTRRAQARRLFLQGRFAAAAKIDPRMGM